MNDLSAKFSRSTARSSSLLSIFDEAIVDPDPYRSRNTVAHAQQAYRKGFLKNLKQVRPLGEGAVFIVALYEHCSTKELFAVKRPKHIGRSGSTNPPHVAAGADGVYFAFKEIQIMSNKLLHSHENIINILGWDWIDAYSPAIIVEFAENGTLEGFLKREGNSLPPQKRREICLDVACGLSALHAADVAHGDIKTANVLVFRIDERWRAKVSDFSHALFGLSLRRKTTYPGSGLYNAPEVRARDTRISSEKIPLCESFSFGLLIWEVLLNADLYLNVSNLLPSVEKSTNENFKCVRTTDLLSQLPTDEILRQAQASLHHLNTISLLDKPLYHHVFEMTLQDRSLRRKDMSTLASRLDQFDSNESGSIRLFSSQSVVAPYASWNFEPWANIAWTDKQATRNDIEAIVNSPQQPQHAELFLVLSRCFAEGYGCAIDIKRAVGHLYRSAFNDCADATCVLESCPILAEILQPSERPVLGSNLVSNTFSRIKTKQLAKLNVARGPGRDQRADILSGMIQSWLYETRRYVRSQSFQYHIGDESQTLHWTKEGLSLLEHDVRKHGIDICDLMIIYETLTKPVNTETFFEVCVKYSITNALQMGIRLLEDVDIENSSWGARVCLWEMLLVEAAKGGSILMLEFVINYVIDSLGAEASVLEWDNSRGESPLHFLSFIAGSEERIGAIIVKLLRLGCSIDASIRVKTWFSPFGLEICGTPLQMAVKCGCLRTIKALIRHNARITNKGGCSLDALEMACSLRFSHIVFNLIKAQPSSKRSPGNAIRAISLPTPRGWFDRIPLLNTKWEMSGIEETLLAIRRCCTEDETGTDIERWRSQLAATDGSALTTAIRAGQRDFDLMLTMISHGLGPTTLDGRFGLLFAIMMLERQDANRKVLLKSILGRPKFDLVKPTEIFWSWQQGWEQFFQDYRHKWNPENDGWTMLHIWAEISDAETLEITQAIWPECITSIVHVLDSKGRTALDTSIDSNSLEVYKALQKYRKHPIEIDIARAECSRMFRGHPMLPYLRSEARRLVEHNYMMKIGLQIKKIKYLTTHTPQDETLILLLEEFGDHIFSTDPTRRQQAESIVLVAFILRLDNPWPVAIELLNCTKPLWEALNLSWRDFAQRIVEGILQAGAGVARVTPHRLLMNNFRHARTTQLSMEHETMILVVIRHVQAAQARTSAVQKQALSSRNVTDENNDLSDHTEVRGAEHLSDSVSTKQLTQQHNTKLAQYVLNRIMTYEDMEFRLGDLNAVSKAGGSFFNILRWIVQYHDTHIKDFG